MVWRTIPEVFYTIRKISTLFLFFIYYSFFNRILFVLVVQFPEGNVYYGDVIMGRLK